MHVSWAISMAGSEEIKSCFRAGWAAPYFHLSLVSLCTDGSGSGLPGLGFLRPARHCAWHYGNEGGEVP